MRAAAILLIGLFAGSCALREDGVKQCEARIKPQLQSATFYKRLPDEIGDLNSAHPNEEAGYDRRWVDINYETRDADMTVAAHRYECVFNLENARVGTMLSAGDRDPRLVDYGRQSAAGQ